MDIDRETLLRFIRLYGNLPELWDTSRKDYTNRKKKLIAYNKLLIIFKNIKRSATLDDVKKKINSLRSNYSKELRRIEASKRLRGEDNVYTPTSWVFHELNHFLKNIEKSARSSLPATYVINTNQNSKDNVLILAGGIPIWKKDGEIRTYSNNCKRVDGHRESNLLVPIFDIQTGEAPPSGQIPAIKQEDPDDEVVINGHVEHANREPIITIEEEENQNSSESEDQVDNMKRKRVSDLMREERKFIKACTNALKTVSNPNDSPRNDKMEAFTTYISGKFKEIGDDDQMLYAESLISQVVYSAIMNKLTRDTALIHQK